MIRTAIISGSFLSVDTDVRVICINKKVMRILMIRITLTSMIVPNYDQKMMIFTKIKIVLSMTICKRGQEEFGTSVRGAPSVKP